MQKENLMKKKKKKGFNPQKKHTHREGMRKIVLGFIVLLRVTIIACDAKRAEKCWEFQMCVYVCVFE